MTNVKNITDFTSKVIDAVGENYYTNADIAVQYAYYADKVAKSEEFSELFFDMLKLAKDQ